MRSILVLGLLLVNLAGCATCHYRAGDLALDSDRCPDTPASQRTKVHIILVKGFDPLDCAGVNRLAETIIEMGYPKVYRIENHHAGFIAKEAERIIREQPESRFVVVGSGSGAMLARHLTHRIAQMGNVDALIEIAPVLPSFLGCYSIPESVRHRVVGRVATPAGNHGKNSEYLNIAGFSYWSVGSNGVVVDLIREEITHSAQSVVETEEVLHVTHPILDHPAPLPGVMSPQN